MAYDPNDIQWNQSNLGTPDQTNALPSNPYAGTIGQTSTAAMNTAGYVDNPAGRALYRAGAPPSQAPQQQAPQQSAYEQAILDSFKASSGFSLQELAERKRQFEASLEWQKEMWRNQGIPELEIKQRAQVIAQDEFKQQMALAQKNFELAQKTQAAQESQFGQTLAEQQRQFNTNTGLDYLKTAANMGSPADVFQSDDFVRGAAGNGAPAFLSALRNNIAMPAFGATSGAAPNPLTAGGLMDRLSGGLVPDSHAAALGAIGGMAQAGGGALSPQAMESLNPDELAAMQSGFKKLGYSMPAFLQSYTQSRIGQGAARPG